MRFPLLLTLALALFPACGSCGKSVQAEDAGGAAAEGAIPAPEGHLADVVVATPNATWGRLQRGIGGAAGILPATLGGMVCAFSGLDASLGPEIDGAAPMVGVVAQGEPSFAWAIALKLVEPRRAKDLLLDADNARYTARAVGSMTALVPKGGSLPVAVALANGGYLVVARNDADLSRLGPYVYRTLPTKPIPEAGALVADAPKEALRGPLRARLAAMWDETKADLSGKDDAARAQHGGRAPDFGDPKAILASLDDAIKERLAVMGDLDAARLVAEVDDTSVRIDVTTTPAEGAGPARAALAEMHPGDAAPLLAGADSAIALLFRDDAAGRAKTAGTFDAAIGKALGDRLAEPEAKRLHGAIDGWTKARGDWMTLGLVGTDGLYARAPVASADPAERAIKDALDLVSMQPFKQALRVRDVKVGPGAATIAYGELPAPRGKEPEPKKAEVMWSAKDGVLALQVQTQGGRAPAKTLGDDPNVAAFVKALGADVTFAAVVQPLKLDPARALVPGAPFVVAWGKKGSQGWAHAHASDLLIRELLRSRMGL